MKSLHRGGVAGNIKLNGKLTHSLGCGCCEMENFSNRELIKEKDNEIKAFRLANDEVNRLGKWSIPAWEEFGGEL